MKTGLQVLRLSTEGQLFVSVSFAEWSNINSGQLRALLFSRDQSFSLKDGLEFIARYGGSQETLCVVKSIFEASRMDATCLVSIQPVRHRRREIDRKKSLRSLNRAHKLLLLGRAKNGKQA